MNDKPRETGETGALVEQLIAHLRALSPEARARLVGLAGTEPGALGLSEAGEAALHAALSRLGEAAVLHWRELCLDLDAYRAAVAGRPLDLTHREFELLRYFLERPGRVATRERLLQAVWGLDYFGSTKTVDVHIHRLRRKLGEQYRRYLQTVRHVGYRLGA